MHSYSSFLKSNGLVLGVGANSYGVLGDGTTENNSVPVLVENQMEPHLAMWLTSPPVMHIVYF